MVSLADAIIEEKIDTIREGLSYGVDLNQLDEYGFTPLIEAAIADNLEITKILIEYGANPNLADATGGTALHWAAENNNLSLAKMLLQRGADPNAYTLSGQPVLVMPLLRRQQDMKKLLIENGASLGFARDYINAKLLGHIFELVGTANIVDPKNQYVEVDFEGFYLEVTLGIITESLMQFRNHFGGRKMQRYAAISNIMVTALERAAKLIKYQQYRVDIKKYDQEIEALINEEPLIIPVGYEGHAITFIRFGDIFVKCDRREGAKMYDLVTVFRMTHPHNFSSKLVRSLIFEKQDELFINEQLPALLGLAPITDIKISAQISGNCSWANVEACVPVLFFLLCSHASDFPQKISHYKSLSMNFFNHWRDWNKERALYECINTFKKVDSVRKACKAEILAAIFFQRLREHTVKDQEYTEGILKILLLPKYTYILENYIKSYCFEDVGHEGSDFLRLLKKYGFEVKRR